MDDTSHFFSWDERWDIAHLGDKKAALTFAVEHFIQCGQKAIESHDFFAVALSGGSTPKEIFQLLTSKGYAHRLDWSKVFLFWGDERSVPATHHDSNFRMAMDAGWKNVAVPHSHIFKMNAEKDREENALLYEETIKKTLGTSSFDLIMLGMGEDGHTASLFPRTKALQEKTALVVANEVPQKKTWRMTFTYRCINLATTIAIYVLGKSKATMVGEVFLGENRSAYPIFFVGTPSNKTLWILDAEAGKKILNSKI